MIGKLTGLLDSSGEDWAMVDVSGVGYVLFCSGRTLGRLPGAREAVSLLVETHVREDHIHLYGFIDRAERDWFRLLGTVQGVGARMALAILSALTPEELIQAIAAQDKAMLTRANGVGPKLAGRITADQESRLAGAVGAEEPHALIVRKTDGKTVEEHASAEVFRDRLEIDQHTHRYSPRAALRPARLC